MLNYDGINQYRVNHQTDACCGSPSSLRLTIYLNHLDFYLLYKYSGHLLYLGQSMLVMKGVNIWSLPYTRTPLNVNKTLNVYFMLRTGKY